MKTHRLLAVMTLPTLLAIAMPNMVAASTGQVLSSLPSTSTTVPSTVAASKNALPQLQAGSKGTSVVTLQNDLNALGFAVGQATGVFDSNTTSQVKAFQQAHHLETDGVVGPMTWAAITSALAPLTAAPISLPTNSPDVTNVQTKQIEFGNQLVTAPDGFTYQGTTYMPIWYVMNTLDELGLTHTWSGNVWDINVPASTGLKVDYSKIKYGKGSTSIAINGTVVAKVDAVVYADPASGQPTTFMPVWYVMNALERAGVTSDWQGSTWTLKSSALSLKSSASTSGDSSGNSSATSNSTTSNSSTTNTIGNSTANATNSTSGNTATNETSNNTVGTIDVGNNSTVGTIDEGGQPVNSTTNAISNTSANQDAVGNSIGANSANTTGMTNATSNSTSGSYGNSTGSMNASGNGANSSSGVTFNSTTNSLGGLYGDSTGLTGANSSVFGNSTTNSAGGTSSNSTGTSTSGGGGKGSFTNVDLRYAAPSNINQQSIDKYLLNNSSPLNGLGVSFMDAQKTFGIDANYLVSHAILESYWGQSQIALAKNNLFGYGAYDSNPGDDAGMFPSDDYAIRFEAWEVRTNYLTPGGSEYVSPTLTGMNVHYATDPNWASGIGSLMSQFATSVGSSVSAYKQYNKNNPAPTPPDTTEPVYYMNGATGTTKQDSYYKGNGVPYFSSMTQGIEDQFFGPLKNGSIGQPVTEIQKYLNQQIHAGLQVDGQFGPATEAAVKKFQSQVMNMANPNGVWSFQMWTTYIQPSQAASQVSVIPPNKKVSIDEIQEGLASGYVVPWYHVVNYGWVDSQYLQFTNVYRVTVQNPAGVQTSIPVYSPSNTNQQIQTLHSGDFVVAQSAKATNGMYQIQFAAQTPAVSNGQAAGTLLTGVIPATSAVKLVKQS